MANPVRDRIVLACVLAFAWPVASADPLDRLAWLAGCWTQEGADTGTMEMWLSPAGGTMLGVSRTVREGKTVAHEFMQIQASEGTLVFIAQPDRQREASFTAVRTAEHEIVFENLAHDFPQRISYRLKSPNELHARIEGTRDGQLRGFDYPMQRVVCPGKPT